MCCLTRGFLGWFNRFFARTTTRYTSRVGKIVSKTTRYLLVYAVILIAMGGLFSKLPGSFLPAEDQGYFINIVQLPPGATQARTLEVLSKVEKFYLGQPEIEHVIGVAGFSFVGRGQNVGIVFVTLKPWDERKAAGSSSVALVRKANMALFQIKQAMIFAVNPPPIPELAALGGFDFRLQDRGGVGREKLLEARNMALGMASQNPVLAGVRPEGQEAGPQLLLDIDRLKAETLGVSIADLNDTLQSTLGVAYINDFPRQGRALRVQMQAEPGIRSTPKDILRVSVRNDKGDMVPLSEACQGALDCRFAQTGSLQRPGRDEDIGRACAGAQQRRSVGGDGADRATIATGHRLANGQVPLLRNGNLVHRRPCCLRFR